MTRFLALFLLSVSLAVVATVLAMWAAPHLTAIRTTTPEPAPEDPAGAP